MQTGVWYTAGAEEGVFNEDQSGPPLNAAYNILIFSSWARRGGRPSGLRPGQPSAQNPGDAAGRILRGITAS